MNALALVSPVVALADGIATTLSTAVAEFFGKRHDDVLRAIRNLLAELAPEHARNFAAVDYTDAKNEVRPAYRLTRDGFTLLAMGFTGKPALKFKLAYIDAFNRMEAQLRTGADCPVINIPAGRKGATQRNALLMLVRSRITAMALPKRLAFGTKLGEDFIARFGFGYHDVPRERFVDAMRFVTNYATGIRNPEEAELAVFTTIEELVKRNRFLLSFDARGLIQMSQISPGAMVLEPDLPDFWPHFITYLTAEQKADALNVLAQQVGRLMKRPL